jgi:hypothetical protein
VQTLQQRLGSYRAQVDEAQAALRRVQGAAELERCTLRRELAATADALRQAQAKAAANEAYAAPRDTPPLPARSRPAGHRVP